MAEPLMNLRPHSKGGGVELRPLGAVKEGGGGTFPALGVTVRGALGGGEKRAASVTVLICILNHDLYSRLMTCQPCKKCKARISGAQNVLESGQKRSPA